MTSTLKSAINIIPITLKTIKTAKNTSFLKVKIKVYFKELDNDIFSLKCRIESYLITLKIIKR